MAAPDRLIGDSAKLPRLLYIGDVSVADTMAGEALLFRLLQFYPPDRLALICESRPGMPALPGVAYHPWRPAFPSLFHSRVGSAYVLWRAWRYYEIPRAISHAAAMFKPDAVLTISHVSGWLGGWQIARQRGIPFHLIAHDDFAYAGRFPRWSRAWAERKFGECYRAAATRFCISDTMEEIYGARFGAPGEVMYPTYKNAHEVLSVSARPNRAGSSLTFAYGGSINTEAEIAQIVTFARAAGARGHRLLVFTPQHALLADRAANAGVAIDARAPVHSDALRQLLRSEADCMLLPQSLAPSELPLVSTAFPTKWADYSTLGLPVLVWAPSESSSVRFVRQHPGCAVVVTSPGGADLDAAIVSLEAARLRRALAETLLQVGSTAFSPLAAWNRFKAALQRGSQP